MDGGTAISRPHRFTVTDYHRMTQAGILARNSRVELIRGQIVDMAAIGAPHFGMVNRANRILVPLLADRAIVSVQNPVRLDTGSEPQPDFAVLKSRPDDYDTAAPRPEDVLLLIEVADTSLDEDRAIKAPLYAESGILEYWIINLVDHVIEVHRQPQDGQYSDMRRLGPGAILDMVALPGVALPVETLLRQPGN